MVNIVALDGYTMNPGDHSWEPVEALGKLTVHDRTPHEEVVNRAVDADVLLTNKVPIGATELAQLPRLKLIVVTATGYNVIDVDAARSRGIPVCNAPEYSTRSVAQHVFAMILSYLHQPVQHDAAVRSGEWMKSGEFCFWLKPIEELVDQTMGIIGYGKIGQAVGKLAEAFGMQVVVHSRRARPQEFPGISWLERDDLLAQSDIVSLHCPQTDETTRMVDAAFLDQMKSTGILVNASRSGLVVESDLVEALRRGKIKAALLDVTSTEPIEDGNPLLELENCLITPHIAWASLAARKRLLQVTADNIRAFLEGQPVHVVNGVEGGNSPS
ncbi:MAG: D-2-hydroxyacid dehydrogenase [Mariniblastus sp.]|nr:D-2-hydroxyacid dehydrogenase [Mariniblastus sp.]